MDSGFILLHRKLLDNPIFLRPNYFQVWCFILLKVNHKESEIIWNGEKKVIKAGAGIFSQKKISEQFNMSIGTVNNILKYLKTENQIEIKSTAKFTEIQVVKWEDYQSVESIIENRMKTKRKQNETNKHDKHDNTLKEECLQYVLEYGQNTLDSFLRYWTEKGKNGKEKWELEKTWETKKRLDTWKKREIEYSGNKAKGSQIVNGINGAIV